MTIQLRTPTRVAVCGAGGHAKVVWDILRARDFKVVGFFDVDPNGPTELLGLPVERSLEMLPAFDGVVVAIGDNRIRARVFTELKAAGHMMISAVHPHALIALGTRLGEGTVVGAGAIVGVDVRLGDNVLVNTRAVIEHDCTVGSHAHIAPAATIAGRVRVGEGALVGLGVSVLPLVSVGDWAVCGAGAMVTKDVEAKTTVVGVPARPRGV